METKRVRYPSMWTMDAPQSAASVLLHCYRAFLQTCIKPFAPGGQRSPVSVRTDSRGTFDPLRETSGSTTPCAGPYIGCRQHLNTLSTPTVPIPYDSTHVARQIQRGLAVSGNRQLCTARAVQVLFSVAFHPACGHRQLL